MNSLESAARLLRPYGRLLTAGFAAAAALVVLLSGATIAAQASVEAPDQALQPDTFPVTVEVDNTVTEYHIASGKVRDVLKLAKVTLGEHDEVNLPLDEWVDEDEAIVVERRAYLTVEREEEIPCEQEDVPTSLLRPGKTRVLLEGEDGLLVRTYTQLLVDGEVEEEELVEEKVVSEPVMEKVLVGTYRAPISPLDFGYELDENGEPVGYTSVMKGQKAAGYSAGPEAGTASGLDAEVGHVAVNPNVIPYGTKMYIRSADGLFVYGYAIAADTGVALMDGRVALDLFYGTYLESALNGIRKVDIYILE